MTDSHSPGVRGVKKNVLLAIGVIAYSIRRFAS